MFGGVQLITKFPVVGSIDVETDVITLGLEAALKYSGVPVLPHPNKLYAVSLNPYVAPGVSPVVPPVTEYVVKVESGEYPTISDHVAPLVPASHSRKYDSIDEPPVTVGADQESSNLEDNELVSLVGFAISPGTVCI